MSQMQFLTSEKIPLHDKRKYAERFKDLPGEVGELARKLLEEIPVTQAIPPRQQNPRLIRRTEPVANCSNLGTLIKAAVEQEIGRKITCGTCAGFIGSLNRTRTPDARLIEFRLYAEVEWPRSWREKHKTKEGEKERIAQIVESAMKACVISPPESEKKFLGEGKIVVSRANSSMGKAFAPNKTPPRFVSSAQFQQDIKKLIGLIPPDITAIAGVARSGLSAATMLSMYLHLPMITIRQTMNDIVATGNGWRLGGTRHVDPQKGRILVVDDTVMTGNSLRAIRPLVSEKLGQAVYAAVYVNPRATKKPDIWAVDLPWPHILEWNMFNSILSPSMALDFDGILCQDCEPGSDDDGPKYLNFIRNAKPLYLPRRVPVPLIVTARIERYRKETEEWLARHKVKVGRLVMHPAKSLRERQRDNIAIFKAKHYKAWAIRHRARPGPALFIESEDRQAQAIARHSGLIVVCPSSCKVYR